MLCLFSAQSQCFTCISVQFQCCLRCHLCCSLSCPALLYTTLHCFPPFSLSLSLCVCGAAGAQHRESVIFYMTCFAMAVLSVLVLSVVVNQPLQGSVSIGDRQSNPKCNCGHNISQTIYLIDWVMVKRIVPVLQLTNR